MSGTVNWPLLGGGLLLIGALVVVLASGFGKDPHQWDDARSGEPAPAFALQTLEGEAVSLSDLQGSPVVLNFWSTWCQPCAIEHPTLVDVASRYKARGVVFLGVLYADEPEAARRFLQRQGAAFPSLVDPSGRIAVDYGISGVPETFVIDPAGQISHRIVGPVRPGELDAVLEPML